MTKLTPTDVQKIQDMESNDMLLALEKTLLQFARLRIFDGAVISTMGQERRDYLVTEMPGYIEFMEYILAEARNTN